MVQIKAYKMVQYSARKMEISCLQSLRLKARSFFWSVFSCIRTEYGDLQTQENTDQEKLRIWTLFMQWIMSDTSQSNHHGMISHILSIFDPSFYFSENVVNKKCIAALDFLLSGLRAWDLCFSIVFLWFHPSNFFQYILCWNISSYFVAILLNLENPLKINDCHWVIVLEIIQICSISLPNVTNFNTSMEFQSKGTWKMSNVTLDTNEM